VEVVDAVRRDRSGHYVTVVHDLVLAVPESARDIADAFGREHIWTVWEAGEKARGVKVPGPVMQRLQPVLTRLAPLRRRLGRLLGRA
jgi:hypothetical protein